MRIGLFGDSYCDIIYFEDKEYLENPAKWTRRDKPWCGRLLDDLSSPILSSGLGGSCLYDSIAKWENDPYKHTYDFVLWSLTWHDRLYTSEHFKPVFLARAERRPIPESNIPDVNYNDIDHGIDLYYKYFYYDNQQRFYHEQSIRWILSLPEKYPNTKFIFLPCTEYSRQVSLEYFQKGILVNFSFETLSNLEPNSKGPMPIMCGRLGHLNDQNHEAMVSSIKNVMENYNHMADTVIQLDFDKFDLINIPQFDL